MDPNLHTRVSLGLHPQSRVHVWPLASCTGMKGTRRLGSASPIGCSRVPPNRVLVKTTARALTMAGGSRTHQWCPDMAAFFLRACCSSVRKNSMERGRPQLWEAERRGIWRKRAARRRWGAQACGSGRALSRTLEVRVLEQVANAENKAHHVHARAEAGGVDELFLVGLEPSHPCDAILTLQRRKVRRIHGALFLSCASKRHPCVGDLGGGSAKGDGRRAGSGQIWRGAAVAARARVRARVGAAPGMQPFRSSACAQRVRARQETCVAVEAGQPSAALFPVIQVTSVLSE